MPCGLSIYENVSQLVPNHLLNLKNKKQERYWPDNELTQIDLDLGVEKTSEDLINAMKWANLRFNLILPLTAGYDSRSILAASKNIISDIYIFTLKHRSKLTKKHPDISIPQKLSNKLGLKHNLVHHKASISREEEEEYKLNNSTSRYNEQNYIFSFKDDIFDNKVWVNGNISGIGKSHYFVHGKSDKIANIDDLLMLVPEWGKIGFFKKHLESWLEEAQIVEKKYNIDIRDLFFWEHRMGNWCARSLNEAGFRFEIFSPHNSRSTLKTMLSVDGKFRLPPNYNFYRELISKMWPEVLDFPFNAKTNREKLFLLARKIGNKIGVITPIKKALNFIYKYR